ncbi:MAG: N-acetyl-gamma-glutamyl-phosphate reductase [Bdellovibrionales bacterium]|nr:N-acetyl-gamma-glutamyl-phosphate reductase [Bdellovibrionales bacterium]
MNLSRVALAGATGYSGQELVRLLDKHPYFKLTARIGREDRLADLKGQVDIAFLCTPNETSLEMAPQLLAMGIHVVDVSGAFRLKQHAYPEWYGFAHTAPEWLAKSEYGMIPFRTLAPAKAGEARLVANPGCFSTTAILALVPLLKSGLVQADPLFIDAKSGTTGAGRKAETRLLFSEIFGEFAPYKVGRHQHWPEIVEAVAAFAGTKSFNPTFITELLPVPRGISASLFGTWTPAAARDPQRLEKLLSAFQECYGTEPDIQVGTDPALTSMKAVVGTNRVHMQICEAFGKPMVFCVTDNLLRGAAGQALMNANLLAGRPVREGLV